MCCIFYSSVLCSVLLYNMDLFALLLFWFFCCFYFFYLECIFLVCSEFFCCFYFFFLFGMHIFWFVLSFHALPSFCLVLFFVVQNFDLTIYKFSSVLVL